MTAGDASAPVEWDFFVSYHGSDEAWAVWIAWQLEAAGYRVLVQAWDMVPGTNWAERMQTGLTRSHRVIAVLSPAYLQFSRFGAAEWQAAWAGDPDGVLRRVIPVRVAACDRPGLLTGLVGIDLFDVPEPVAATRLQHALASAIAGRAKPSMPPAFPRRNDTVAAMPQPPFPSGLPRVWNMPLRNPNFTGRTTDLTALRTGLATGCTMTVQALRGMGGSARPNSRSSMPTGTPATTTWCGGSTPDMAPPWPTRSPAWPSPSA